MPKSTTSFLFPDINVWIALTVERHAHHVRATKWFDSVGGSPRLYFCRFTQLGLLRLLTLEAVMGPEVLSQAEAWEMYDRWVQDERIGFLDEPPEIEEVFRGLTQSRQAAPKDWADSYLVAFAQAAQLTVVTFDQAFSSKTKQLVLLEP
jgi:toxin-antitoxin system PIN domain toxin